MITTQEFRDDCEQNIYISRGGAVTGHHWGYLL